MPLKEQRRLSAVRQVSKSVSRSQHALLKKSGIVEKPQICETNAEKLSISGDFCGAHTFVNRQSYNMET